MTQRASRHHDWPLKISMTRFRDFCGLRIDFFRSGKGKAMHHFINWNEPSTNRDPDLRWFLKLESAYTKRFWFGMETTKFFQVKMWTVRISNLNLKFSDTKHVSVKLLIAFLESLKNLSKSKENLLMLSDTVKSRSLFFFLIAASMRSGLLWRWSETVIVCFVHPKKWRNLFISICSRAARDQINI